MSIGEGFFWQKEVTSICSCIVLKGQNSTFEVFFEDNYIASGFEENSSKR
jgi:hypothetical protein